MTSYTSCREDWYSDAGCSGDGDFGGDGDGENMGRSIGNGGDSDVDFVDRVVVGIVSVVVVVVLVMVVVVRVVVIQLVRVMMVPQHWWNAFGFDVVGKATTRQPHELVRGVESPVRPFVEGRRRMRGTRGGRVRPSHLFRLEKESG